jgi:hypothetical protein
MAVPGSALVVSSEHSLLNLLTKTRIVDFAMTEAALAVVRILQEFPVIKLPTDETVVKTGKERQTITIVLAVGDGCRICFE